MVQSGFVVEKRSMLNKQTPLLRPASRQISCTKRHEEEEETCSSSDSIDMSKEIMLAKLDSLQRDWTRQHRPERLISEDCHLTTQLPLENVYPKTRKEENKKHARRSSHSKGHSRRHFEQYAIRKDRRSKKITAEQMYAESVAVNESVCCATLFKGKREVRAPAPELYNAPS